MSNAVKTPKKLKIGNSVKFELDSEQKTGIIEKVSKDGQSCVVKYEYSKRHVVKTADLIRNYEREMVAL